jgi:hypothetical protein
MRLKSALARNAIEEVVLFSCPVQAVQIEFRGLLVLDLDLKFRYSAFFPWFTCMFLLMMKKISDYFPIEY